MDIKELVEWVANLFDKEFEKPWSDWKGDWHVTRLERKRIEKVVKQILSHPNFAWIIREGDEVPLGVETETHIVILLKEALKEVNND